MGAKPYRPSGKSAWRSYVYCDRRQGPHPLGLTNRVPVVCQALKSKRFLRENHLVVKDVSGPPSGLSTTVKFTFEIASNDNDEAAKKPHPLWDLLGIGKAVFDELGSGESFIKNERAKFSAAVEVQGASQTKNSPRSGGQSSRIAAKSFRRSKRGHSAK